MFYCLPLSTTFTSQLRNSNAFEQRIISWDFYNSIFLLYVINAYIKLCIYYWIIIISFPIMETLSEKTEESLKSSGKSRNITTRFYIEQWNCKSGCYKWLEKILLFLNYIFLLIKLENAGFVRFKIIKTTISR